MFYRAVVQAILMYGSEMWVLLATMEKKVEGDTHDIPQTYHGEVRSADSRQDTRDARGGSSVGGGGNAVDDVLYMEKAGKRGTVGGVTTDIISVCREEGL